MQENSLIDHVPYSVSGGTGLQNPFPAQESTLKESNFHQSTIFLALNELAKTIQDNAALITRLKVKLAPIIDHHPSSEKNPISTPSGSANSVLSILEVMQQESIRQSQILKELHDEVQL